MAIRGESAVVSEINNEIINVGVRRNTAQLLSRTPITDRANRDNMPRLDQRVLAGSVPEPQHANELYSPSTIA
jgi:hypothetical protein